MNFPIQLQDNLVKLIVSMFQLEVPLTHLEDDLLLPRLDRLLVSTQKVNHYLDSIHLLQNYLAAVVQSDMCQCFQF